MNTFTHCINLRSAIFTAAVLPNLDSYVFAKVVKDVVGVVVEEETDDARYVLLSCVMLF